MAVILGLHFLTASFHPEWLSIGAALVLAYVTFCGLSLLLGLDNDDRTIVTAIQRRLLGAVGRTPSLS
jgi:hypothetical protein